MSTILGIYSRNDKIIQKSWGDEMLRASQLWPYDQKGSLTRPLLFLACQQRFNTPQAPLAKQPYSGSEVSQDSCLHLVFDGRLDNRKELAVELKIKLNETTTDEALLLAAFKVFGKDIGSHLIGDYVVAIYNETNHSLFLLRDHLGVRPLFIVETNNFIAFSSNKKALLTLPFADRNIDEQWLADFLTITKVDFSSSFYQGIKSFMPAHWLYVDAQQLESQKYWELDINNEIAGLSDEEYIARFRALLSEAIECRLRSYGTNASELSGGLDSTSITATSAILLKKRNEVIHAFSHQLPPEYVGKVYPFSDESELIDALDKSIDNIQHTSIYSRDEGVIEPIIRSVKIHAGVQRGDLSVFAGELFRNLQSQNIRTLLSGFGGDQLVTSHGAGWAEELSNKNEWKRIWQETNCLLPGIGKRSKFLLSSILKLFSHHLNRAQFNHLRSWKKYKINLGVNPHFIESNNYPQRYFKYPTRPFSGSVKQREFQVIHSPHILYRLEDSALGAASYGVDYRYPLLDIRLLQFSLSLPLGQKFRQGIKRRMVRETMQGVLPDKIRLRHDKSRATIPTVRQRYVYDKEKLLALMENLPLPNY